MEIPFGFVLLLNDTASYEDGMTVSYEFFCYTIRRLLA